MFAHNNRMVIAELSWNVAQTWSVVTLARLRDLQSRVFWVKNYAAIPENAYGKIQRAQTDHDSSVK